MASVYEESLMMTVLAFIINIKSLSGYLGMAAGTQKNSAYFNLDLYLTGIHYVSQTSCEFLDSLK